MFTTVSQRLTSDSFNNCLQCLSCIFSILAIFIDGLDNAADIIQIIARLVYHITAGCMVSSSIFVRKCTTNALADGTSALR